MGVDNSALPAFTILLPVHRPPMMLPYAVASVLGQTRQDFELFIICDGAPPETAACTQEFAANDARIRAFLHPKGERHGELYRDQALRSARGRYVCQIADDDLWFPNHLEEMATLLTRAEFGNTLQVSVRADGRVTCLPGDLARTDVRKAMLKQRANFFGPTASGYRLETYRRLPVGWSPAPEDIWSDLYMWRKFLSVPDIVCATRFSFTALHISASLRARMTNEDRAEENRRLLEEIQDPMRCDAILQTVMRHLTLHAQLTNRALSHLADIGGSDALLDDLQRNDERLLAELNHVNRELSPDSTRHAETRRRARKPKAMQRLLRWLTGAPNRA